MTNLPRERAGQPNEAPEVYDLVVRGRGRVRAHLGRARRGLIGLPGPTALRAGARELTPPVLLVWPLARPSCACLQAYVTRGSGLSPSWH